MKAFRMIKKLAVLARKFNAKEFAAIFESEDWGTLDAAVYARTLTPQEEITNLMSTRPQRKALPNYNKLCWAHVKEIFNQQDPRDKRLTGIRIKQLQNGWVCEYWRGRHKVGGIVWGFDIIS